MVIWFAIECRLSSAEPKMGSCSSPCSLIMATKKIKLRIDTKLDKEGEKEPFYPVPIIRMNALTD